MITLKPVLKPGSPTLWDAWFDAGHERLLYADGLRYRDHSAPIPDAPGRSLQIACGYAQEWFARAMHQASSFPAGDYRVCISKAGYAWATYWLGDKSHSAVCAEEALACLALPAGSPPTAQATAHVVLATARAHLIVGELAYQEGDLAAASEHFDKSLAAFGQSATLTPDVAFLQERRGQVEIRRGQLQRAVARFQAAEQTLQRIGGHHAKRAFLVIAAVDNQILDGQYRQAALKYSTWSALWKLEAGSLAGRPAEDLLAIAQGLTVFVRAWSTLGDLAQAEWSMQLADEAIRLAGQVNADLQVGLESQRVDLLRMRGCLARARAVADGYDPASAEHPLTRVRAYLARGEVQFELGDWPAAEQSYAAARTAGAEAAAGRFTDLIRVQLGQVRLATGRSQISEAAHQAAELLQLLERGGRSAQPEFAFAMHALSECLLKDNRSEESFPIAHRAHDLLLSTVGPDHPVRIVLLLVLAEIAVTHSFATLDNATAATGYRRCDETLELLQERFCGRGFDFARCEAIRGQLLHMDGQLYAAEAALRSALRLWTCNEEQSGAAHPEKSWTMLALAALYVRLDCGADAERLYEAAAVILLPIKGSQDGLAYELNRQGNSYYSRKLWREAEWWYLHAEALFANSLGPQHPSTRQVTENRERAAAKQRPVE